MKKYFRLTQLSLLVSLGFPFMNAQAAGQCDAQTIAGASGASQLAAIKTADNSCYGSWFGANKEIFEKLYTDQQVIEVNQELKRLIASYRGEDEQAKQITNLGEFIRAAYYVRYSIKNEVGDYPKELDIAISKNITAFLNNLHAKNLGRDQVAALNSMTIMTDNVKRLQDNMARMVRLLDSFNQDTAKETQYVGALNNLFRAMAGHSGRQAYYDHVAANPRYVNSIYQFVLKNDWAIGTDAEFIVANASRELGRLMGIGDQRTKDTVLKIYQDLLTRYPLGGKSDKVWVGIAEMVTYYARDKAAGLGLSDAKQKLESKVMTLRHRCHGPAIVRAQNMTKQQAMDSCEKLTKQESRFHQLVQTNHAPVANDKNKTVEVAVFDSNKDYVTYSSFLFGNTTNNGGQYLEGDPAKDGNQARFVAYRQDNHHGFAVWNLEHEYVHYLDGRYNQKGGFSHNLKEGYIVWWLEGFAEYMAHQQDYPEAVRLAKEKTYTLSQVVATSYNNDINRIYRWGYLGVRFLFEKHPEEVQPLLALSRSGNYKGWASQIKRVASRYDNEFSAWLESVSSDSSVQQPPTPAPTVPDQNTGQPDQGNNENVTALLANHPVRLSGEPYSQKYYFVDVPENATSLSFTIAGDGDADLYISHERKAHYYDAQYSSPSVGSSHETVKIDSIQPGRYYISVAGRGAFNNVQLIANVQSTGTTEPVTTTPQEPDTTVTPDEPTDHGNSDQTNTSPSGQDDLSPVRVEDRAPIRLDIHQRRYVDFYVPEGYSTVRVWLTPQSETNANVNLYVSEGNWPSTSTYGAKSESSDSHEYIELPVSQSGYVYLMLTSDQYAEGLELYATYF
ncbi:M9 family metallopeptidase [Algicola sagamiensis]|uniref:M9 family metallopeptidase n=1 Tax=Algicola sagamiensis TaxID=163869 RepID=UPI00036F4907|nr:M9 family metallopeptidase [Algicola sagamiensis]